MKLRLDSTRAGFVPLGLAMMLGGQPAPSAAQDTLHVGPDRAHTTITAALEAANPGDRVVVHEGLYREPTLVVDRPLELVGEGWPVLDGEGEREILRIEADGVTVRGLESSDMWG